MFYSNETGDFKIVLVKSSYPNFAAYIPCEVAINFLRVYIIHIPNNMDCSLYTRLHSIRLLCPYPATFCCPHLWEIWMCLQYQHQYSYMLVYPIITIRLPTLSINSSHMASLQLNIEMKLKMWLLSSGERNEVEDVTPIKSTVLSCREICMSGKAQLKRQFSWKLYKFPPTHIPMPKLKALSAQPMLLDDCRTVWAKLSWVAN